MPHTPRHGVAFQRHIRVHPGALALTHSPQAIITHMEEIYFEDTAPPETGRVRPGPLSFIGVAAVVALVLFGVNFALKHQAAGAAASAAAAAESRTATKITYSFTGNIFTGFALENVRVKTQSGSRTPLLRIDKIKPNLSASGLLQGSAVFDTIVLIRPTVTAELASGRSSEYRRIISAALSGGNAINCRELEIKDGKISIRFSGRNNRPDGITFKKINGGISRSPVPGTLDTDLSASLGDAAFKIRGKLETGSAPQINLTWESANLFAGGPPPATAAFQRLARRWELGGKIRAKGTLTGDPSSPSATAHLDISNFGAFGLDIGNGGADASIGKGAFKFTGAAGALRGRRISADMFLLYSNAPTRADARLAFAGIEADAILSNAAPDLPKLITGPAGGTIHLSGEGINPYNLKLDADVMVLNGDALYPTPAFSGQRDAWAPAAFDTLSFRLINERPRLTIKEIHLAGPDIAASGTVAFTYGKDHLTDDPAGPVDFDAHAAFSSDNVGAIVARNKYIGNIISGAATGAVELRGRSSKPQTYDGGFSFTVKNGVLANPYDPENTRYPPDTKPARFSFDLLTGYFKIANGAAGTDDLHLRGQAFNADIYGYVGFDGSLKARAETGVNPEMIPFIEAFLDDYKKVKPETIKGMPKVKNAFEVAGTIRSPMMKWDLEVFRKSVAALVKSYDEIQSAKKVAEARKKRAAAAPSRKSGRRKR